ncbi:MAG: DUF6452 family protein [Bacteroidaceae bacterium]|nr:DUF6452 family protein [Bacteroidaceae bacterium]
MKRLFYIIPLLVLIACSSNNCPMENTAYCVLAYYDSEETAIKYLDTVTVSTLMPGWKTQYIYRRLGTTTIVSDTARHALIEQGYTQTVVTQRNEKVLVNRSLGVSSIKVPMSYFNPVDTLVFSYGSISLKDTLYIFKESYPHVDYPECGTYRFHHITDIKYTDAAFDKIEISNPTVNYEGQENIRIHFNGVDQ